MDSLADDNDEELEHEASAASRFVLREGKLPMQEVAGSLRVRVVSGFQLAAADRHMMSESTSDPYVILKLQDDASFESERMTYPKEMTLNPMWNETFQFGIRKVTETLKLSIEVIDDNQGKRGPSLGKASLVLTMQELSDKADEWLDFTLDLRADRRSSIKPKGGVVLQVYWEPWTGTGYSFMMRKVLRSRKACGILGALVTLGMSPLLIVAADSRWLCKGDTLHSCTSVSSGARQAATDVASIATKICGFVHFFGAMGMFGRHWRAGFPSLFELVEEAEQDYDNRKGLLHPDGLGGADEKGLDLHFLVKPLGLRDYAFTCGVGNLKDFSSKTLILMLRYVAWVGHIIAIVMLTLALVIVASHVGMDELRLAEGFYLTIMIDFVLICTLYLLATNHRRGINLKRDDDLQYPADANAETSTRVKQSRRGGRRQVALQEPLIDP
mmetsp:Transcript_3537/g.8812  ORF Transcript_3537/g.8812 Transcript_3537/m.8812 type:complete len:442 (+) Transcript_3537:29-1354(+)